MRPEPAVGLESGRTDRGVSLLEVVVALTILGTVLISLTGVMWQMGRQTRQSGTATHRSAAIETAAALAEAAPWDSLPALAGCQADTVRQLVFTRCIDVTPMGARLRRLRAVITTTGGLLVPPETLTVHRNKPLLPNPLQTP